MAPGIDFGRHSDDYAAHRPGFPASFYERLGEIRSLQGTDCLDVGTGPGTMAIELAARGASVVGVDIAEGQIAAARRVADERGLGDRARFLVAGADRTGENDAAFDLVTAGQCWHWFDGEAVLAEVLRVLRPGGLLAIAYYSYLAERSALARDTEDLVLQFNPTWTMARWTGVFPDLAAKVGRGGFRVVDEFCYEHPEPFTHERWRGRIRTCNGVGSGGLTPDDVLRFDEELQRLMSERYPDPVDVEHRVWCLVARKPEG